MKLSKQLTNTKKARTLQATAAIADKADELGETYTKAKEEEKAAKVKAERANADIKALAAADGITEGKQTLVYGKRFKVGYTTVDPKITIDIAKAEQLLPEAILKKVRRVVIDEAALVQLVEEGKVERDLVLKIINPPAPAQQRIVVDPIL